MVLNDNVYKVLKWLGLIVIPSLSVLIKSIFQVWGLPYGDAIATTLTAIGAFIGAIIGVSSANLKPEMAEQAVYVDDVEDETVAESSEETKG